MSSVELTPRLCRKVGWLLRYGLQKIYCSSVRKYIGITPPPTLMQTAIITSTSAYFARNPQHQKRTQAVHSCRHDGDLAVKGAVCLSPACDHLKSMICVCRYISSGLSKLYPIRPLSLNAGLDCAFGVVTMPRAQPSLFAELMVTLYLLWAKRYSDPDKLLHLADQ